MAETTLKKSQAIEFLGFRAYLSNDLSLTGGSWATADFDTENFDVGADFNTTTYTWTCPADGYYQVSAQGYFNVAADGDVVAIRVVNSSEATEYAYAQIETGGSAAHGVHVNTILYLSSADTLKVQAINSNNDDVLNGGESGRCFFSVYKVG